MAQLVLAVTGVQPLPSPPILSRLLFEDPLILTAILIIASVAVFFLFNAQGKVKKAILWSGVGLLLGIGVLILASAIETDREKIIAATTPLVRVTAAADTSRLEPLLDDQVRLTNELSLAADELPHGEPWDKTQILDHVRSYLGDKFRLKPGETAIIETQGVIDGPGRGRTQVHIRVTPELFEFPWPSWWRIDWKQDAKGEWRVIGIQPLDVGQLSRRR